LYFIHIQIAIFSVLKINSIFIYRQYYHIAFFVSLPLGDLGILTNEKETD